MTLLTWYHFSNIILCQDAYISMQILIVKILQIYSSYLHFFLKKDIKFSFQTAGSSTQAIPHFFWKQANMKKNSEGRQ